MTFPIFLLRHGETDWNHAGKYQGEADIPLNDTGRAQAALVGMKLKVQLEKYGLAHEDVDFVASSLSRARETMEIARLQMGLPRADYEFRDDLKEIAVGVWSGLTYHEISARNPDLMQDEQIGRWTGKPEGGESFEDLRARVLPWFLGRKRPTVVVCHGQVSRAIRGHHLGLSPRETLALRIPQDGFFILEAGHEIAV